MSFYDCEGNCEASEAPVELCRCRCRGVNHGRLRYSQFRPAYSQPFERRHVVLAGNEYREVPRIAPLPALPDKLTETIAELKENLQNRPVDKPILVRPTGHSKLSRIGKALKHSTIGYSQAERNDQGKGY